MALPPLDEETLHAIELVSRLPAVPTILKVIIETTGLRLSMVARVTDDTWTACAARDEMNFGLVTGGQLDVGTTLCREVRAARAPIVIADVDSDPTYCNHPTPKMYRFKSYISVPIFRSTGEYFGNVCALDSEPRPIDDGRTLETVRLFADLVGLQLEEEERQERLRSDLAAERSTAEQRERFIAVLSHELRNPMASIAFGTRMLESAQLSEVERRTVARMRRSAQRIDALVDEVTDLARGRLTRDITVKLQPVADIADVFEHVIAELRAARPDCTIEFSAHDAGGLHADPHRLQQLLSNLVANALDHGAQGRPVNVRVEGDRSQLIVRVTNRGETIPADVLPRLFEPFVRHSTDRASRGLGLGLYLVDQIARAHGGRVTVRSDDGVTTFECTLPRT